MADKPSRSLIMYGYGLAPFIKPSHTHIHTVASKGCCGFLALDNFTDSGNEDEKLFGELAQILDAREACSNAEGPNHHEPESQKSVHSISERYDLLCYSIVASVELIYVWGFWLREIALPTIIRFMGMKAAIVTNSSTVRSFGENLGFTAIGFDKLGNGADLAASELLRFLGFENGQTVDSNQFDLVFVLVGFPKTTQGDEDSSIAHDIDSTNSLIGGILEQITGTDVGSRLLLSLMMSYGTVAENDPSLSLSLVDDSINKSNFSAIFPRQSYALKGGSLRNDIRQHCPVLVAQWQEAVTRKDTTEMFSFDDFRKHSANLAIPADRFLYEIAFKLWKAPKYGA